MVNNSDKKKILKKMLNDKTLFEMNGGAGVTTPSLYGSAIPSSTKIGTGASTDPTLGSLVSNITGIKTTISETQGALGSTNFVNLMRTLNKDTDLTKVSFNGALPQTVEDVTKKGYVGLPIYIADQISKVTGTMASGQVAIGKTVDELKNDPVNNLTLVNASSFDELLATPSKGINRYLTLYDLITNDQGQFLSSDVEIILNQFSSLAQFKHLPSLQYLTQQGGQQLSSSTKKRSRKIRK